VYFDLGLEGVFPTPYGPLGEDGFVGGAPPYGEPPTGELGWGCSEVWGLVVATVGVVSGGEVGEPLPGPEGELSAGPEGELFAGLDG